MQEMPQDKNPFRLRKGQQELIKALPSIKAGDQLSIHWPTGYGKSIGFALAWKHCHETGIANRLLLVVANITQLQQIINDFAGDCRTVVAPCPGGIWPYDRSPQDIMHARSGKVIVFVCTVQQLDASNRGGVNMLKELLTTQGTRWMIGFDEFHHYGEDMSWGNSAKSAMQYAAFTLAMSATPYRRGPNLVFAEPEQSVSYTDGVAEKAVKPMLCHSYDYKVTVVSPEGETTYTTSELLEVAPDGIDQWEERKNIRYSTQYIHPLIVHPLTRLREKCIQSGVRLQMIIRAMSCLHAQVVCEQVRTYTGDAFSVDWIGTGPRGRSSEINDNIRRQFCPPKDGNGKRPQPTLDILVQVSMAGEGFDTINVAEIVDLFPVSKKALSGRATADKQFYGRGSRIIPGAPDVRLHISVPTDHPLHIWAGKELHRWMDSCGEEIQPREDDAERQLLEFDWFDIPPFPKKRDIELLNITTEDQHFRDTAKKWENKGSWRLNLNDPKELQQAMEDYCAVGQKVAESKSEHARLLEAKELLDNVVGRIGRIHAKKENPRYDGKLIGLKMKEVNQKLIRRFGKQRDAMTIEELELAYSWCQNYLASLKGEFQW